MQSACRLKTGTTFLSKNQEDQPRFLVQYFMRTIIGSLAALSILLATCCSAADAQKPFKITIVPESSSGDASTISWNSNRTFYVVMLNQTDKPQRVFNTWNSWGSQALSFEFTLPSGRTFKASRKPQIFSVNVPRTSPCQPRAFRSFPFDWPMNGSAGPSSERRDTRRLESRRSMS